MIIGTAGHIDHGKTALVKALTGVDTDRLPEEKRRGITVELGFAPINLNGVAASVIDVPGHEAFVKTMVAGAAGIDVALLVVAADEGIMPQTKEHLAILEILEIPALVVAITKSDLVDPEWRALVREEISAALARSCWPGAPIVACSSVSGEGLAELRASLSLFVRESREGTDADVFRLPVDRCFTVKGTGTVVTGTVWSGSLAAGAAVRILPSGRSARVRRLQRHATNVDHVGPGDRAAIALVGVEVADVERGSNIVVDEKWEPTSVIDAAVTLLPHMEAGIGPRSEVTLHLAGADASASLRFAENGDGDRSGIARIKLDVPITARGGERFVLRLPAPVGTIGGGIVLDPFPGPSGLAKAARAFAEMPEMNPGARLSALLSFSDEGISVATLPVRLGVSRAEVLALMASEGVVVLDGRCYSRTSIGAAMAKVEAALADAETTFPLERGVQLESVSTLAGLSPNVARAAIARLTEKGAVVVRGSVVARAGWTPSLDERSEKTVDSLVHAICTSGSEPPTSSELSEKYGKDVPDLLRYLARKGRLVQVAPDRFYAQAEVDVLIEKLRESLQEGVEYGPSQLRDVLGFSRRYLIPFLEYCDQAGVTERKEGGRTLKQWARKLDTDVAVS